MILSKEKFAATQKAQTLADECERRYDAAGANRLFVEGKKFCAVGGYDHRGEWSFALDYESPEDRSEVREWLRAAA